MKSVLIIGGGILGATLACELGGLGAQVTLVDPMLDLKKATVGSLAWLNVSSTADMGYAMIRKTSLELWHDMKAKHPGMPVTFDGALMWGGDAGGVAAQVMRLNTIGWTCDILDHSEILERVPGLSVPDRALFARHEGYAHPKLILDWMLAHAKDIGVHFVADTVQSLEVGQVVLKSGETLMADAVVVTAGNSTAQVLKSLGIDVPMRQSPGVLMKFAVLPKICPYVMATPELDFWQAEDGTVFASSSLSKTSKDADGLAARKAEVVLAGLFDAFGDARVQDIILRSRPIPLDGFPIIGRSGVEGVWLAVTHSGVTLAPLIAQALADDVLEHTLRHDVRRFALDRDWSCAHERAAL